jgi:hypothetical protein
MPTNRPPEAKEKANRTTATLGSTSTTQLQHSTTQLQYQYHRQVEVAGPTSGRRASPRQYVPSHVFGAMKSRGVLTPADSTR